MRGITKTEFIEKFEFKIELNTILENKNIDKKNMENIIKYILKSNNYLKKHSVLFKKYVNEIVSGLNELLSIDFFINDKILCIYIARRIGKIIKEDELIKSKLKEYLDEKNEMNSEFNNKYRKQLSIRNLVYCDDDCFLKYLPTRKSEDYYSYDENKKILYSQFDEELEKDYYPNGYYSNRYILNVDELNNIKHFEFNLILKEDLVDEINNMIKEYDEGIKVCYQYNLEKVFRAIKEFENINIYLNEKDNFVSDYIIRQYEIYDLLKQGMFNYNVNDKYFIVDREVFSKDGIKEYGNIYELKSINEFLDLIDFDKWIKYMRSHDINSINELYYENMYDEFENIDKFSNNFEKYIKYNFSNEIIGINVITNRIIFKLKDDLHKLCERYNLIRDVNDRTYILGYDIRENKVGWYDGDYYGKYIIFIGGKVTDKITNDDIEKYLNENLIKESVLKRLNK